MAGAKPHIAIEGLKEVQADLKRSQGKLPAVIGEVHKRVGNYIISKVPPGEPRAVGEGTGAQVRASATKRDVVIRAGFSGRENKDQWGKKEVQPFRSGRPYIVGVMEDNEEDIAQMFLDAYAETLGKAFYKVT